RLRAGALPGRRAVGVPGGGAAEPQAGGMSAEAVDAAARVPRNVFGPVYPTSDGERMGKILDIRPADRVLEVGGGFYQFPRADVVTDISFSDSGGRNGAQLLFRERCTYVECPAEALPFKDKEFDFVYCSHVLEHTLDPARGCAELQRVARRGYLEV